MPGYEGYFPDYDGTFNWDDPLVAPWWIPGYTSQNADTAAMEIPAHAGDFLSPGFPSNLSFCRLRGNYFDPNSSGTPGFLTLYMSDNITVQDGDDYIRMPQRLAGWMNQPNNLAYNNWGNGVLYVTWGHLDITVFCTDQTSDGATITTDSANAFTYYVTEHMLGGRTFQISVPSSSSPGPVDINSLIIPGTTQPYAYDPVNPMGNDLIPLAMPMD